MLCFGRSLIFEAFGFWHIGQNLFVAFSGETFHLVHECAGSRRDQAADDDVLLEAVQAVHLAVDGGIGEDTRRFLERGGRDEGTGGATGIPR